jgi:cytoskeleton protein RodZ
MSEENAAPDPVAVSEQDRKDPLLANEVVDVGECLRLARKARKISVGDAAAALKLSPHQVEALEANDWFQWPRMVTRGFVRNYARYLGLDTGSLMEALDHASMPQGPELVVSMDASINMPHERQRDRRDTVRVVAGLIVLMLAFLVCFFIPAETWQATFDSIKTFISDKETTAEPVIEPLGASGGGVSGIIETAPEASLSIPEPIPDTASLDAPPPDGAPAAAPPVTASPEPIAPPPIAAAPSDPAIPVPGAAAIADSAAPLPAPADVMNVADVASDRADSFSPASDSSDAVLAFAFAQPSWVEVRDRSGRVVLSRINPAGSRYEVAGEPPFALIIGNASHVSLQYKGRFVDLSPSRDDVARLTLE